MLIPMTTSEVTNITDDIEVHEVEGMSLDAPEYIIEKERCRPTPELTLYDSDKCQKLYQQTQGILHANFSLD